VAIPALKDDSPAVRAAAARALGAAGDHSATTLLVRRVEEEEDEGVVAELLGSVGRLGGAEALRVLAEFARPGGLLRRRSARVRGAAVAALGALRVPEARALLEQYTHDREPAVRRAAEAAMQ
jgi:HEAT repeat protein